MAQTLGDTPTGEDGIAIMGSDPEKMDGKLFARNVGKIAAAEQKMKDAKGVHNAAMKEFKKDGGQSAILKMAQRIAKLSATEARQEFEILQHYLALMNVDMGRQLELFASAPAQSEDALKEAAYLDGYRALNEGFDTDENPHSIGTAMSESWLNGHAEAKRENIENFTDDSEEADQDEDAKKPTLEVVQ